MKSENASKKEKRTKGPFRGAFSAGCVLGILLIGLATVWTPVFSGCGKDRNSGDSGRESQDDSNNAGDDEGPDYGRCLRAFDYMTSQCGAQFSNEAGDPMSQNDLIAACGLPKVECAVACYEADENCDAIRPCLENTCGLG